jgi:hypothetical protein
MDGVYIGLTLDPLYLDGICLTSSSMLNFTVNTVPNGMLPADPTVSMVGSAPVRLDSSARARDVDALSALAADSYVTQQELNATTTLLQQATVDRTLCTLQQLMLNVVLSLSISL